MKDLSSAMMRLSHDIDAQTGSLHQDDDLTVLALRTGPATPKVHSAWEQEHARLND